MARQVLENGVILPAEYSDDWYDDMTSNLTKLDDVIGSDSEKLSSADVGAAALSNSYNDLDNLPTIPTKTSDLTNDSNFVDTSNSAVASGITSAKVTSYDSHVADTDIHVTTADKSKWNNGVSQSYVFRYSSTALVASSTNSNTLLDNTDNLKVGDKVIDSDGVLFSITAIDSVNSTFTVGSALVDLALDANVVHTNRNDDVSIPLNSTSAELGVTGGYTNITFLDKNDKKLSGLTLGNYSSSKLSYARLNIFDKDTNNNEIQDTLEYAYVSNNANAYLRVSRDNFCALGTTSYRWKGVYAQSYYYGSDNVEFLTKFVTTDTNQTISGNKDFTSELYFTSGGALDVSGGRLASIFRDKDRKEVARFTGGVQSSGRSLFEFTVRDIFNNEYQKCGFGLRFQSSSVYGLFPISDNTHIIGANNAKLKSLYTNQINSLTPSSLSLPCGTLADQIDISSYFANTGSGDTNSYTASANGWIYLYVTACRTLTAYIQNGTDTIYSDYKERSSDGQIRIMLPIQKNNKFTSQWTTSTTVSITKAVFIPCQGNV